MLHIQKLRQFSFRVTSLSSKCSRESGVLCFRISIMWKTDQRKQENYSMGCSVIIPNLKMYYWDWEGGFIINYLIGHMKTQAWWSLYVIPVLGK